MNLEKIVTVNKTQTDNAGKIEAFAVQSWQTPGTGTIQLFLLQRSQESVQSLGGAVAYDPQMVVLMLLTCF